MNGATRTLVGVMRPPEPTKFTSLTAGCSSPAPPGWLSGEELPPFVVEGACVAGGEVASACVVPVAVVVVVVPAAAGVVPVLVCRFSPPPQPATRRRAISATALYRMRLTGLEDHDARGRIRLDLLLERLIVGLDRRERVVVARDHGAR